MNSAYRVQETCISIFFLFSFLDTEIILHRKQTELKEDKIIGGH